MLLKKVICLGQTDKNIIVLRNLLENYGDVKNV